ncbi:hypothetical protein CS542_04870 [Pedobacter sp. IW39]|nr:hypothetical protein CS542_04870 [Pedobacter sp. IW39]
MDAAERMRRFAQPVLFHMDIEEWDFDLIFRLNKLFPLNIAVYDIIPMEGLPHAWFDAVQRAIISCIL